MRKRKRKKAVVNAINKPRIKRYGTIDITQGISRQKSYDKYNNAKSGIFYGQYGLTNEMFGSLHLHNLHNIHRFHDNRNCHNYQHTQLTNYTKYTSFAQSNSSRIV